MSRRRSGAPSIVSWSVFGVYATLEDAMDGDLDALLAAFARFSETEPVDLSVGSGNYLSRRHYHRLGTRGL
jgi:hypothetical protein